MGRITNTALFHISGDLEPVWECISDLFLSSLVVAALVKFSTRAPTLITVSAMLFQWIFDSWYAYRKAIDNGWSHPAIIMTVAYTSRWIFFLILGTIYRRREWIRAVSLLGAFRERD